MRISHVASGQKDNIVNYRDPQQFCKMCFRDQQRVLHDTIGTHTYVKMNAYLGGSPGMWLANEPPDIAVASWPRLLP